MKTRINQLVVVALFTLLMLGGNVSAKGTELTVSSLENMEESELVMESWMIDQNFWNTNDVAFEVVNITEESLELENWMVDNKLWKQHRPHFKHSEMDKKLSLESWMVDEKVWNNR